MNEVLIEETKKALGYTEGVKECRECKFAQLRKAPDESWYWWCTYSNICHFKVKARAHCDNFGKQE